MTRVHVVGTGLIGASLGIALTRAGHEVTLQDPSPTAQQLARDLGAGSIVSGGQSEVPEVVVVAAPPDVAAAAVIDALTTWPEAIVTDVASVKATVLRAVEAAQADTRRYVGSHPMAGRERSGAAAARGDLFQGRAWVIVPSPEAEQSAIDLVTGLARDVGSMVVVMPAHEHDAAVAAVSHVPQVASSIVAALLREQPEAAVGLAGQGLRDVTRIAASDPRLWTQILSGNAEAVRAGLLDVRAGLTTVIDALDSIVDGDGTGALGALSGILEAGNLGHARIPGKHGAAPTTYAVVSVVVPDEPGALGRLFNDMGAAGFNLEDLTLEHGLGQPVAIAYLSVVPAAEEPLRAGLTRLGWHLPE